MNGVSFNKSKKAWSGQTIRPRGDIMMKGSIKADRMQTVCRLRADSVKATQRGAAFLRPLRVLYKVGTIGDLTDGQLLERFATDAGEVAELAFAALVERHEDARVACLPGDFTSPRARGGRCLPGHVPRPRSQGAIALGARLAGSLAPSGRLPHRVLSADDHHPAAQARASVCAAECSPLRFRRDAARLRSRSGSPRGAEPAA